MIPEDDRIKCRECIHSSPAKNRCLQLDCKEDMDLPRRCIYFRPISEEGDQRSGFARWPTMKKELEITRKEERAFRSRR